MQQISVFLASRFGEFSEVRAEIGRLLRENRNLNAHVIDLNDGAVASRPPYDECMRRVEQADLMVLLMGRTYGQLVDGREKSYTHYEYLHALDQDKRVLPFFIGEGFTGTDADYALMEPGMQAWARDVRARHTYGFETVDAQLTPHFQASEVVRKMYSEVLELIGVRWDEPVHTLSPEAQEAILAQDTQNALRLSTEQRDRQALGLEELDDDHDPGPEAAAAREQREAARQALEIGEFRLALDLMRRSVDRAPMDPESNEQLARLALAMAGSVERSRQGLDEALAKATLAGKIFAARQRGARAAGALLLAAQIHMRRGENAAALGVLGEALALRPNEVAAYLTRARILVRQGETAQAVREVMRAAGFNAGSLQEVFTDPELRTITRQVREAQKQQQKELVDAAQAILQMEGRLTELLGQSAPVPDAPEADFTALLRQARSSVLRQRWHLVQALATQGQEQNPEQRAQAAQDAVLAAQAQVDRALVHRLSAQARRARLTSAPDARDARALDLEVQRTQALEEEARASLGLAEQAQSELQRPVTVLTEDRLRQAVELFEKRTLTRPAQLLPFPSLYNNARDGRLVRMSPNELKRFTDELARNWRQGGRPQVTVDPLPTWWPSGEAATRRLYRITVERGDQVTFRLSGTGAYAADATGA